ncbi:hypothetical protein GCM10023194_27990 [Planotetraspora phitsanulokensis]|uniref:Uncharacterized protein n=1 Tax=Planotetraspora phitsanulokensis TaxID=575192 RepID=A0A8J3XD36_9ACTN|nr:hypothetical protein Pph01_10670 [Planotetraspora phitsanulokensis]
MRGISLNLVWQRDQAGNLWSVRNTTTRRTFYSTRVEPAAGTDGSLPHIRLQALLSAAATTLKTSAV